MRHDMIFSFSLGRSATKWLANLVDQAPNTVGVHENVQEDFPITALSGCGHNTKMEAEHAIACAQEILDKSSCGTYFEANCRFRLHARSFKGKVQRLFWMRHPAKVVESHLQRGNFMVDNHWTQKISPNGVTYARWKSIDRFERICWMVKSHTQNLLDEFCSEPVYVEEVNRSYDYLDEHINKAYNIEIPKDAWEQFRDKRFHSSSKVDPINWKDERKKTFRAKFSDIIKELKYEDALGEN